MPCRGYIQTSPGWGAALLRGSGMRGRREPRLRRYLRAKQISFIAISCLVLLCLSPLNAQQAVAPANTPTFYRDALPILQEHCQVCHRSGGIAPMAFETYA